MQDVCPVREPLRQVHSLLEGFLGQVSVAQVASHTVPHALVLVVDPVSSSHEGSEALGSRATRLKVGGERAGECGPVVAGQQVSRAL